MANLVSMLLISSGKPWGFGRGDKGDNSARAGFHQSESGFNLWFMGHFGCSSAVTFC
jgi:hypothetical protein